MVDSSDDNVISNSESEVEPAKAYKKGGYHRVKQNEVFNGRFTATQKLGWGHFSIVWQVNDKKSGKNLAMKLQRRLYRSC